MNEPRFGNRRTSKKSQIEDEVHLTSEPEKYEETVPDVEYKSPVDILSFMEESQKKRKVIPMRQVIFRLPVDKFDKVEKAIGSMSIQQFYSNLTDFYLSKIENSSH